MGFLFSQGHSWPLRTPVDIRALAISSCVSKVPRWSDFDRDEEKIQVPIQQERILSTAMNAVNSRLLASSENSKESFVEKCLENCKKIF